MLPVSYVNSRAFGRVIMKRILARHGWLQIELLSAGMLAKSFDPL